MEKDYSLKESFQKMGVLPIPILVDEKGNVIDGVHRKIVADQLGLELRKEVISVKNPAQFQLVRLVTNDCRRQMTVKEKTEALTIMAESGMTVKEIAELVPYGYDWVLKYIPDTYKRSGGYEPYERTSGQERIGQHPIQEPNETILSTALKEPMETEEQFAERFIKTFKSHIHVLSTILEKDFPIIIGHMSEEHDCNVCVMRDACSRFLKFLTECMKLRSEIPICMQKR